MSFSLILKKGISWCFEPLGMIFILLGIVIYFIITKRIHYGKILITVTTALLFFLSYPPLANFLVTPLESYYTKFDPQQHSEIKYIHVLGNGHNTDETQPISSHLNDAGTKRVLEGVLLYKSLPSAKLVFTGYAGRTKISNAQMNAQLALVLGVKQEDIIISPKPEDTQEEALFMKSVVENEAFALVTSATHMPRAMMLFESLNMHPIAAPTDFKSTDENLFLKLPSAYYLYISQVALHEYLGIIWAKLRS